MIFMPIFLADFSSLLLHYKLFVMSRLNKLIIIITIADFVFSLQKVSLGEANFNLDLICV